MVVCLFFFSSLPDGTAYHVTEVKYTLRGVVQSKDMDIIQDASYRARAPGADMLTSMGGH